MAQIKAQTMEQIGRFVDGALQLAQPGTEYVLVALAPHGDDGFDVAFISSFEGEDAAKVMLQVGSDILNGAGQPPAGRG